MVGVSNDQKHLRELFYCWSHGWACNATHTSATCHLKKEGHQDSATSTNRMGGSMHMNLHQLDDRHVESPRGKLDRRTHHDKSITRKPKRVKQSSNVVSPSPPTISTTIEAVADTGATGHFFGIENTQLLDVQPAVHPITVSSPNGAGMRSTHVGKLALPDNVPDAAKVAHILPDLQSLPLISIGQLCDSGCKVSLDQKKCVVTYDDDIILSGERNPTTRLWHLRLPTPAASTSHIAPKPSRDIQHQANAVHGLSSPAQLVAFSHAALFSPALSTLEKALRKGYIQGFPGLTVQSLKRYPPNSVATAKGHLDQTRKNTRSTKKKQPKEKSLPSREPDPLDDIQPISDSPNEKTHCVYAAVHEISGQVYSDQTGKFPVPSEAGNKYVMIVYDYDSNHIFTEPMSSRSAPTILKTYKKIHAQLCAAGLKPKLQRLDNECSAILKEFMNDNDLAYQLTPAGMHRRNSAERAIRTAKNHFIAGLCTTDEDFPLACWDKLMHQNAITLNLLRGSRINPKLSAYAQIHGQYDFNKTPMAPPGIKIVAHNKPSNRGTWSAHGEEGWYIGPAMEHYRCYRVYIKDTRAERTIDTVAWFPNRVVMPQPSTTDLILASCQDIVNYLSAPHEGSPLATSQKAVLHQLTELLHSAFAPISEESLVSVPTPALTVNDNDPESESPPNDPVPDLARPLRVSFAPETNFNPAVKRLPKDVPTHDRMYLAQTKTKKPKRKRKRKPKRARNHRVSPATAPPSPVLYAMCTSEEVLHANEGVSTESEHFAFYGNAFNPDTGCLAQYKELSKSSDGHLWLRGMTNEFGRLLDGNDEFPDIGTKTMRFIRKEDIPKDRWGDITYCRVVVAYRPEKDDPNRVRLTCGGDKVNYPGPTTSKTADLQTCKLHVNSVISTPGARFITLDIKDYYLGTIMKRPEYMRIHVSLIPKEIYDRYNLQDYEDEHGYVYAEITRGMYGLPQAGRLAQDQLETTLKQYGYAPVPITPGLWRHEALDIVFTLVVDDFGIRFTRQEDAEHLISSLQKHYKLKVNWDGDQYCGLQLNWDYVNRTVDISMPGYIERVLQRFHHLVPDTPQHSPHAWQKPAYGARVQYAKSPDTTPPLSPTKKRELQALVGCLLYYGRAVDHTILTALGDIASEQEHATDTLQARADYLLDYCATHPDAAIRYWASDMVLRLHADSSYLSCTKARSRAAGFLYLSDKPDDPTKPPAPDAPPPTGNGPVHVLCQIMREVVGSAAEAELGALFYCGKEAVPMRHALEEMGHPQPPTVMITDNSTASGIANDNIKQKRSKAMDMRYYWVRDRCRQGHFQVGWRPGRKNYADYFTKHHHVSHHRRVRPAYVYTPGVTTRNYYDSLVDDEGIT